MVHNNSKSAGAARTQNTSVDEVAKNASVLTTDQTNKKDDLFKDISAHSDINTETNPMSRTLRCV